MTASQTKAAKQIENWLTENLSKEERYADKITEWKVEEAAGGYLIINAKTEYTGLPETNLLRALSDNYWLFFVGKRGKIECAVYPSCFKQFKGKEAFGFFFK